MEDCIKIIGAREHNLKNISLNVPKNRVVIFTGVSGSGKSTIVFDTIYAEAQRQLLETFSSFARRRLPKIEKPKVDEIRSLSPVIKIDQKRMGENRRSTVGTVTEIYTYLRLLYSRCGTPMIGPSYLFSFNNPEGMCPECNGLGTVIALDESKIIDPERSLADGAIKHYQYKKGGYLLKSIQWAGFFDMDRPLKEYSREELDRLLYSELIRIPAREDHVLKNITFEGVVTGIKRRMFTRDDLTERDMAYFSVEPCRSCEGARLNEKARSVLINGKNITELSSMEIKDLYSFLETVSGPAADSIVVPAKERLKHLIELGLGYLSLDRPVSTLSGGESQRVKMSKQLSCDLVNLIYVFDEPTVGLHPKDVGNIISMIRKLCEKGNSILVVEHDPEVMESADYIIDVGPGAGTGGGNITFCGTIDQLKNSGTLTGSYLTKRAHGSYVRKCPSGHIEIKNARLHNLKDISVRIPTGVLVCVTGVAGSGKSTLVGEVFTAQHPDAIVIDQSAIGRSSRANPATYTGAFDLIRGLFAKSNGVSPNMFSFNSDGACKKCNGLGHIEMEMHFLDDVKIICDECNGKRYSAEALSYLYNGKDISEVLDMTVSEAIEFFENPGIRKKLHALNEVGLDYLTLGQSLSSLSGGEAQRLKLASELPRKGNIYVMDEPTTGLHMADVEKLIRIMRKLVDKGNTVIVVEHNLDVIKNADRVIDMGPGAGSAGGEVIAEGTPEEIARVETSYTGQYLKELL